MPALGGEVVASQLREIGIDLEIIPVEWADWLKQVFTDKDYDLTIVSHTEPNDIDIYSRKDYYFKYDNPAFDKIIDELNLTSDEAKRTDLFKQAQKILADDAVNGFLFELPKIGVWDAKLEGPVGERADPGQRSDQGEVGGVASLSDLRSYGAPLCPAGHLPHMGGDRPAAWVSPIFIAAEKRAGTDDSRSPPMWGRCPAGQRGAT